MYFCDDAIGLSGVICGVMPRLVLWRTVMKVVVTLIRTAHRMTSLDSRVWPGSGKRNLSGMWAPKMSACCALSTNDGVSPYGGGFPEPTFQSEIPRRTLNRAKNS